MTYSEILEKAVLDISFREQLVENPRNTLDKFSIKVSKETIEKLSTMSKKKFLSFIENIIEAETTGGSGYM